MLSNTELLQSLAPRPTTCACGAAKDSPLVASCEACERAASATETAAQWSLRLREKCKEARIPESCWPLFSTRGTSMAAMLTRCPGSNRELQRVCENADPFIGVSRLALPLTTVIFGDAARGKTSLACTILGLKLRRDMHREAIEHHRYESRVRQSLGVPTDKAPASLPSGFESEDGRKWGRFVRAEELWSSGDAKSWSQTDYDLVSRAKTAALMVIDELVVPSGAPAMNTLRGVIWERRERALPTIITTGLRPDALKNAFGDGGFEHRLGFVGDASAVHIDLGTTAPMLRAVAS